MRNRDDRDERNRGEFSGGPDGERGFGGDYARDTHRGGLGDDYARDDGWSGAGRADDYARDSHYGGPGPGGVAYGEAERMRRISFRGRGPKGWRPSDERIRENVNEALTDHHDVDATEIEVAVENGEVTLTGMVNNRWEKRLAEDVAAACRGVHDVHNRLRVANNQAGIGKASE